MRDTRKSRDPLYPFHGLAGVAVWCGLAVGLWPLMLAMWVSPALRRRLGCTT